MAGSLSFFIFNISLSKILIFPSFQNHRDGLHILYLSLILYQVESNAPKKIVVLISHGGGAYSAYTGSYLHSLCTNTLHFLLTHLQHHISPPEDYLCSLLYELAGDYEPGLASHPPDEREPDQCANFLLITARLPGSNY